MKDEILVPVGANSEDILPYYHKHYNNQTYQDFKRAVAGLDFDYDLFIDAAIDVCRFKLTGKSNGKVRQFYDVISQERWFVQQTALHHFLNFASEDAINAAGNYSEPEILEPDEGENSTQYNISGIVENPFQSKPEIPLYEVVPAFPNYEKLANALRQDMRKASHELLKLRMWMDYAAEILPSGEDEIVYAARMQIDDALAYLDCTDHLQAENEDGTY